MNKRPPRGRGEGPTRRVEIVYRDDESTRLRMAHLDDILGKLLANGPAAGSAAPIVTDAGGGLRAGAVNTPDPALVQRAWERIIEGELARRVTPGDLAPPLDSRGTPAAPRDKT